MDTIKAKFRAAGQLRIRIDREDGTVERYLVNNRVLDLGEEFIASRMIGDTPAVVSHMAVGEGTTAVDPEDTVLENELARVAVVASRVGNTVTYNAVFGAGVGTGPISEAGLLNAASGGTMTCRSVFGVKTKDPLDVVTISWDNIIEAV